MPPGLTVLAVDSTYEQLTQAASAYREQNVYSYFASKGYQINCLSGPEATQANAEPAAADPNVIFLTGVSHGKYNSFTGDFNQDVFSVGYYNPNDVQGKIVHFLSCDTAKILGPDFVANGCRAFIGYDEFFNYDPNSAQLFFECDAQIDLALADGLTVADAVARALALFEQRIQQLLAANQTYSAQMLRFCRDHLRSPVNGPQWGDPTARLS